MLQQHAERTHPPSFRRPAPPSIDASAAASHDTTARNSTTDVKELSARAAHGTTAPQLMRGRSRPRLPENRDLQRRPGEKGPANQLGRSLRGRCSREGASQGRCRRSARYITPSEAEDTRACAGCELNKQYNRMPKWQQPAREPSVAQCRASRNDDPGPSSRNWCPSQGSHRT